MQARTDDRLAAATGLVAILVVGVAGLASAWPGDSGQGLPAVWWAAYGAFLVAFVADSDLVGRRPVWLRHGLVVAVEVVSALAVWFAGPQAGFSAVLFVVSAVSAAYDLSRGVTTAVIALQTLAVAVGTALVGESTAGVVIWTLIYAAFQSFAGLVVLTGRREAEGRAALAAAHADLRAASTLLAASTRDVERLRISRDLHDVVGHQLTALALELEVASHRVTGDGVEHVTPARTIAKDLLRDVRPTAGDLRGPVHGLAS